MLLEKMYALCRIPASFLTKKGMMMQNFGSTLVVLGILAIFLDLFNYVPKVLFWIYSELNLNQDKAASRRQYK
ncbi:hypothetical protein ELB75_11480 [Eikenella corrodens]|uniref:Uncharacterized protein n=1 Tax=Eikenella corrodens TaxID=539 RepID=A0A3S9SM26_EIKCO|nr:hypothetical protein ELB75_11480 [Eikenella corrodens]